MLFTTELPAPTKCNFTHTVLSSYLDAKQPPTKKQPFSTILAHPFSHTLDLILPEETYERMKTDLEGEAGTLNFSKVFMTLGEVLDGAFFNVYIKKGNILMISEGRAGIDDLFSLHEGVLRLELNRVTYEKCGLVGTPIQGAGRKHVKSRYLIEINLRQPSMLHGKKGFERIIWACKNVLNHSLTWLFHDVEGTLKGEDAPISKHHPFTRELRPQITRLPDVRVPPFESILDECDPLDVTELYEWLSMVSLHSPRVMAHDRVDPYISRYQVPDFDAVATGRDVAVSTRALVKVRWHGLIPPAFITDLWLLTRKYVREDWTALNVSCFRGRAYSVLNPKAMESLTWEIR